MYIADKEQSFVSHYFMGIFAIILLLLNQPMKLYAHEEPESVKTMTVDCAQDTEFSKALGVIVGHEVAKEHYKVLVPEVFMQALFSQMYEDVNTDEMPQYELKNTDVVNTTFPSLDSAFSILKKWPQKTSVEKNSGNFISAYKEYYGSQVITTMSGLLYRVVDSYSYSYNVEEKDDDSLHEMIPVCRRLKMKTVGADTNRVNQTICYQRQRIERKTACEIREKQRTHIVLDVDKLKLDHFPRRYFGLVDHNMIAGWAEALDVLNQRWDKSGVTPVLEVVIPAELAYQNDYVTDSVRPGEALWFLLTSTDSVAN